MRDSRLNKLAKLIVNYSLALRKGEYVLLKANTIAEPLLTELYRECLAVGAHPEVEASLEGLREILLKEGTDQQIEYVSPLSRLMVEKFDAMIYLWGGTNTRNLSNVAPEKVALRTRSVRELAELQQQREEKGEFRWCGTQFPTHSDAQEANMSLDEYEDFVFQAGLLDQDDPVAKWREISARQQTIVEYLDKKKTLHIVSGNTDLKMSIEGRTWVNCDGKVNFPDGEVFTTPVEDSVEGFIRFSFPGIFYGKEIEDIYLEFREGKVVKATASKGEDLLLAILETDEGAKRLGEIAIGTNYGIDRFTKNMLFDEKIGGTVHAAIGKAPHGTKGKNSSGIHWDMLCDMRQEGKIFADGELFYTNGQFLYEVIDSARKP